MLCAASARQLAISEPVLRAAATYCSCPCHHLFVCNIKKLCCTTCLGQVDETDRPLEPPVLREVEVVWNPFDDIVPRRDGKAIREAEK